MHTCNDNDTRVWKAINVILSIKFPPAVTFLWSPFSYFTYHYYKFLLPRCELYSLCIIRREECSLQLFLFLYNSILWLLQQTYHHHTTPLCLMKNQTKPERERDGGERDTFYFIFHQDTSSQSAWLVAKQPTEKSNEIILHTFGKVKSFKETEDRDG